MIGQGQRDDIRRQLLAQRLKKSMGHIAQSSQSAAHDADQAHRVGRSDGRSSPQLARAWGVISAAALATAEQVFEGSAERIYAEKLGKLNGLCLGLVAAAFAHLHLFPGIGDAVPQDKIMSTLGITETHQRALTRLLQMGVEAGWLSQRDGVYARVGDWPVPPSPEVLRALQEDFTDLPDLFDFVLRSGRALPEILTGRKHATEMLFPDGRMDIAERLYTQSPPFRYCNAVAAEVLRQVAGVLPPEALLSVGEIGAGTGATTQAVLPAIEGRSSDYFFSDISHYFLDLARGRFSGKPLMRYGLLDIEKDMNVAPDERFDVIVAAHVLHATRDIGATLRHTRRLLVDSGILILLEETAMHQFFSITMGLQTGFDRFEDKDLRTDHPLLSAGQWQRELIASDFSQVLVLPDLLGIQPIIAQAGSEA